MNTMRTKDMNLIDISAELEREFGAPGSRERLAALEHSWEEYNAQILLDTRKAVRLTQEEVAKRVGKNRSTVANSLRLLKLPEDMQRSLSEGKISAGHARAILSVVNATDQRILFAKITGSDLSVREAERLASEMNGTYKPSEKSSKKSSTPVETRDPDLVSVEQKLIELLGTKVSIKGNLERGSIVIEYFSADDLDRVYTLIENK